MSKNLRVKSSNLLMKQKEYHLNLMVKLIMVLKVIL